MSRLDLGSPGGAWVYYLLLVTLILLPLPFGAVYQWSWAGLGSLVGLLLLASTLANFPRHHAFGNNDKTLWVSAALYFVVILWMAVQASGVTPDAWGHAIWQQTSEAIGGALSAPISLNPYATWSEILKLLTYAGVFWLAALYGRDRKRTRAGLWLLGIAGALYAAYGLVAHFTGLGGTLWGREMSSARAGVSSVFVNRNMYVDYAAFGFLAVLSLGLDAWSSLTNSKRDGIVFWQQILGGSKSYLLLLPVLGLVILVALVLTGSRGGVLAAALASLVLYLLALRGNGSKPRTALQKSALGLVVVGAWLCVYLVAGELFSERLSETTPDDWSGRLDGYDLLLTAIGEAPLTGYGAGNSLDVFYLFNDGRLWRAFNYAHSIYLGAAVELGIPAAILLFAAVGLIAFSCFRGAFRRRRDQIFPALGGALSVHVAVHGFVDSPLYLAANAATYSFLMGLAYAQSQPSRRH